MFFAKIADGVTKEKMWMKEEREENIRINGEKYVKEKSHFPKWTNPVIMILILAVVAFLIYNMFSGILRAIGDSKTPYHNGIDDQGCI